MNLILSLISIQLGFKRCFELCISGGQGSFPCFGAWISPTWSWLQDSAFAGKNFQIWWETVVCSFFTRSAALPICFFFGEACYSEASSTGKECSLIYYFVGKHPFNNFELIWWLIPFLSVYIILQCDFFFSGVKDLSDYKNPEFISVGPLLRVLSGRENISWCCEKQFGCDESWSHEGCCNFWKFGKPLLMLYKPILLISCILLYHLSNLTFHLLTLW